MKLRNGKIAIFGANCDPMTSKNISCDHVRWLEEDKEADEEYKYFLLNHMLNDERADLNKKRRVIDEEEDDDDHCYLEGVNDPQFELFLQKLKGRDKSYVLEGEENGSPRIIVYEGDLSLDKECDVKRENGTSDQIPCLEYQRQRKPCSQSAPTKETQKLNESESGKGRNVKSSSEKIVPDHEYHTWRENIKLFDDYYVLKLGGNTVVYEKGVQYSSVKDEYNDMSSSDVEFLGSTVGKKKNGNIFMFEDGENNRVEEDTSDDMEILEYPPNFVMNDVARFKREVIAALRKPYNQNEYDKLLQDVEFRRPEMRHLDLRYGRERSCSVEKKGKSYLDHYPELERRLRQVQNDKRRRLNLLRGFFIWLEKPGPFCPWKDAECLAIKPGSG